MDYNELITDLQQIPIDRDATIENLDRLIRHATYLAQRTDVTDSHAKDILSVAPSFIHKQLSRLGMHIDDEADIIAWISRSLMELLFMLRYMYSGRDQYDELIKEQLKDIKDIDNVIYPDGTPSEDNHDEVKTFFADMQKLWTEMQKFGVEREKLKRPSPARHFAKGAGLLDDYRSGWWIHSKYVHPTAYLLFGKREFVYGDGARLYFWVLAQYYAARNLRDLHMMIKAINH